MKQIIRTCTIISLSIAVLFLSACKEEEISTNPTKSTANTVVHFSPFGHWTQTTNMNADSNGNLYVLMRSPGGTQMSANGTSEFYLENRLNLVKLDNDGFLIWQKKVSQLFEETKLFIDHQDNIYVKLRSGLEKFDPQGNVEQIVFADTERDVGALQIDDSGNYYFSSGWGGTIKSKLIQKYSTDGSLVWEHDAAYIRDIRLSEDNNSLYVLSGDEISKFQASDYKKEWSQSGSFEYGTSFLDVDQAGNVYLFFQQNKEIKEGNVTASLSSTVLRKYDNFGNLLFEKRFEEDKVNYLPKEMNVRNDHIYLAVHSYPLFGDSKDVSHGSFIAKLNSEDGREVWRQSPSSEDSQFTVYGLSANDEGNLWTGFGFHLTWRAAEDYLVESTFGDFTHEQSFSPTGGWKFNLASLEP